MERERPVKVTWKCFSLEQVNSKEGPEWKIWDQPPDYVGRGLRAFRASEAARRQGDELWGRFHMNVLTAYHRDKRDIDDEAVLREIAWESGLDMARFDADYRDRSTLQALARDHTEAVERYGAFGVPTMVFPNGNSAYLRLRPVPPPEEAAGVFDEIVDTVRDRPYVLEIKRPTPPRPAS